jgi:hypothetical protein
MGHCQGKTCCGLVAAILEENSVDCRKEPFQNRPPLRNVSLAWLAGTAESYVHPEGPTGALTSLNPDEEI